MKSLKDILTEALINNKVTNKNEREVWHTYEDELPYLRLTSFEDFIICNNVAKGAKTEAAFNNIKSRIENGIVLVSPLKDKGMLFHTKQNEKELKHDMNFVCTIDINDFSYDNFAKLKDKYNLN